MVSVTAGGFTPQNSNILIISTSSNKVYALDVEAKQLGLYDIVFYSGHDKERAQGHGLEPNGFNFDGADAAGVDYALNRAISTWYDGREWLNSLCKRVME